MNNVILNVPISKIDNDAHIIYGVVYKAATLGENGKPAETDTQGNWATAEEVKKACHNFNRKLLEKKPLKAGVDKQHNEVPGCGAVLESYVAKAAIPEINAAPGDWVAAVEVTDPASWAEIVKGDITGFSIGGKASIIPAKGGEKVE